MLKLGRIAVLLAFLFCSLGINLAAEQSNKKTVLKLLDVPRKDVRGPSMRANRLIFERFLELNPDIEVIATRGIKITGQDQNDALTMSLAAGTAPDILPSYFRKADTFIQLGFFMPLDKYIEEDKELIKSIHPKVMPVIRQKGPPDQQEHFYFLPYGEAYVMSLQYRKDVFKEAGLDPERPPKNWDEFFEYTKKITNPAKNRYGFVNAGSWYFANFIYQAGGDLVARDEKGEWKAVYDSPAGVAALKYYHRFYTEEYTKDGKKYKGILYPTRDNSAAWAQGQIGMTFTYMNDQMLMPPGVNPDLIGVAPLPDGPNGFGGCEFGQDLNGINSQVKDPKVINAALRYLKFMASDEPIRIRTKIIVEEGWGKFIHPKYLKKFGYSALLDEVNPAWVKISEDAFKYAKPEPYGKGCDMIYKELDSTLDKLGFMDKMDYQAELSKAAKHTNEQLMGIISDKEMSKRRTIVTIFLVVMVIVSVFFGAKIIGLVKEMSKSTVTSTKKVVFRVHLFAWLFMIVAVMTVLIWSYYPIMRGLVMAFQDYNIIGVSKFVGLDNFIQVLWQPLFWLALKNTVIYVLITLSLGFFAPIILAIVLNEIPRGSLFFRIVFYLPTITSGVVVLLLWKQFYDPSSLGFFNTLLGFVGVAPQKWLQDPRLAMLCVIIPGIWGGVGSGCIFYLAALKNVPDELYEAASIDGAGFLGKIFNVTFPTLRMLLIINFVGAFVGSFHATERILVMTGGGPAYATHVVGLEIFYNAFVYLKFGYATAVAWILGSMLVGFTVIQLRYISQAEFRTAKN